MTMAPHVLCIHQNFVSARQAGNARPIHLLAAMLARGFHVDVVTTRLGYLDDAEEPTPQGPLVQREGNLRLHRLSLAGGPSHVANRGRSYLRFLATAGRYLPKIRRVDVVYATSPPLPQLLLSVLASARRDAPMILEVRDLWPAYPVETGGLRSAPLIKAMEWLESLVYRAADHCIVLAPAFAEYLVEMGVSPGRITVVPTGGDPVFLRMDPAEGVRWREAHGLGGRVLILYAGSFNEHYHLSLAVAAARKLARRRTDIHWLFAGNGRDRRIIDRAAGQCPTIHSLGPATKDELLPILLAADVGLVSGVRRPIIELTMHGKLFDYLAAGLPILSTIDGQAGEIVRAADAGIVLERADEDCLAAAAVALAEMPDERRRALGARGRQWVMKYANSVHMAEKVADVVGTAGRGRGRSARLAGLAAAALAALGDAVAGRSGRAVRKLFGQGRDEVIRRSFRTWLAGADAEASSGGQAPPAAREMPALLSDRDR